MVRWFRPKPIDRSKLLTSYIDSLMEEVVKPDKRWTKGKNVQWLFTKNLKKAGDNFVAAEAEINGEFILFHLSSLQKGFDGQLLRIISHEMAHLRGANEREARKQKRKKPRFHNA